MLVAFASLVKISAMFECGEKQRAVYTTALSPSGYSPIRLMYVWCWLVAIRTARPKPPGRPFCQTKKQVQWYIARGSERFWAMMTPTIAGPYYYVLVRLWTQFCPTPNSRKFQLSTGGTCVQRLGSLGRCFVAHFTFHVRLDAFRHFTVN